MSGRKWINTNSFKNFKEKEVGNGYFRVMINKGDFEGMLVKKDNSKKLFVVLSGSWDSEKHKWPYFQHLNWQHKLDGHILYLADPTLLFAKDLRIGWYVGTAQFDWATEMSKLVKHIAQALAVETNNISPIGEASGGFASLMLASKLNGSTAIAINPQTEVLSYHKRFVVDFLEKCFDGVIASRVPVEIKSRLSATQVYQENIFAKAVILQNKQSVHHYTKHFLPFCERLDLPKEGGLDSTGRIQTILCDEEQTRFDIAAMLPILQQRAEAYSN